MPLPKWHQPSPRSQPLGARFHLTGALPTLMLLAATQTPLPLEVSLLPPKPHFRPSRLPQEVASYLLLAPRLLQLSINPTASQTWAASYNPGCHLEVFLAASSGCPARFPHQQALAAQGSPLELSPTPLPPPLPSLNCLLPTRSSPMAWPQDRALG